MVRFHHERWDGCGYPDGLRPASRSPISAARVFAVADVLDALTTDRPYRPACISLTEAQGDDLGRESGTQFDPQVVGRISLGGR